MRESPTVVVAVDDACSELGPGVCAHLQAVGARVVVVGRDPVALLDLMMTLDEPVEPIFTFTQNELALERALRRRARVDAVVLTNGLHVEGMEGLRAAYEWAPRGGSVLLMQDVPLEAHVLDVLEELGHARLDVLFYERAALSLPGYAERVYAAAAALVHRDGAKGTRHTVNPPGTQLLA